MLLVVLAALGENWPYFQEITNPKFQGSLQLDHRVSLQVISCCQWGQSKMPLTKPQLHLSAKKLTTERKSKIFCLGVIQQSQEMKLWWYFFHSAREWLTDHQLIKYRNTSNPKMPSVDWKHHWKIFMQNNLRSSIPFWMLKLTPHCVPQLQRWVPTSL